MKRTRNILKAEEYVAVAIVFAVVLLYETDVFMIGLLATSEGTEFIMVTMMEILTISLIPLALRLFKFDRIGKALAEYKEKALLYWGTLRMMMLCVPLVINTLLYYQFMNVAFGYMAIICLVCLAFVNPTMNRCLNETSFEK